MGFFKKSSKKPTTGVDGIEYSMTPRHGHSQDVFDKDGIRQVAGCLPIDAVNKRFLLVTSSSNPDNWVIPKGGWEKDETQKQAAMRETWEEAGVKGTITRHVGIFAEKSKTGVKAHHWIYEMEIKEVTKKFPEMKKRARRWFTYDEAMVVIKAHYIHDALSMSSLSPLSNGGAGSEMTGEGEKKKKKKDKKKSSDDEDDDEDNEKKKKKKDKKKSSDDEDDDEDNEKKKKKKELTEEEKALKKEKKKQKKEKKTAEKSENGNSEDEDDNSEDTSNGDDEDGEKKKKKKNKKNKKGEITELSEQELDKFGQSQPIVEVEEVFDPMNQHLRQLRVADQNKLAFPTLITPPIVFDEKRQV